MCNWVPPLGMRCPCVMPPPSPVSEQHPFPTSGLTPDAATYIVYLPTHWPAHPQPRPLAHLCYCAVLRLQLPGNWCAVQVLLGSDLLVRSRPGCAIGGCRLRLLLAAQPTSSSCAVLQPLLAPENGLALPLMPKPLLEALGTGSSCASLQPPWCPRTPPIRRHRPCPGWGPAQAAPPHRRPWPPCPVVDLR